MRDSLLRIALRAMGRLLADGRIDRVLAARVIRDAWVRSSVVLLPEGTTSSPYEQEQWAKALVANEHWCGTCPGVPHRVDGPGHDCPACADEKARRSA